MKVSPGLKKSAVLLAGVFFCFAPLWAPHFQQLGGKNLFVTADSMLLLGVALLLGLLSSWIMPQMLLKYASGFGALIERYPLKLAILSLLAVLTTLYSVNQHILHSFLSSADEHSCYFLAECLRRGRLYVDMPPLAEFFKVVHVGMRDGKWFSVYPPGWPLIWSLGLEWKVVDWLNPVLATLSLIFFYKTAKMLFGKAVAWLGLFLIAISPFFIFTSASYFSHSTCLFCISLFLYAFLRWREAYETGKDPVGWALLWAFAVGYGLMTRYLTMAAVAGPFLLFHYLPVFFDWKGWGQVTLFSPQYAGRTCPLAQKIKLPVPMITFKRPRLRKSDWIVFGTIIVFMILILYQNYLVTGKPFRAPNKHDKSWERLGFRKNYTPSEGLIYILARFFYLSDWFPAAIIVLYLLSLFKRQGYSKIQQLFRFGFFYVVFAYFFYFSWGGNQFGPRYYYEALPFLCVAAADYFLCCWREGSIFRKKFLLTVLMISIVTSGYLFWKQGTFFEEASRQRKALYDFAARSLQKPSIVFVRGFLGGKLVLSEDDAIRNSPFLDGKILYAHDLGEKNGELRMRYPDRDCYRGSYDRERKQPFLERLSTN